MVTSLSLAAPFTSHSSPMTVLVISLVFTIFTPSPRVPRSGEVALMSSPMSRRMAAQNPRSRSYFTMSAAIWLLSPSKSTTLPSPTSLSTDMRLPCPKVAPSVVSMVETLEM